MIQAHRDGECVMRLKLVLVGIAAVPILILLAACDGSGGTHGPGTPTASGSPATNGTPTLEDQIRLMVLQPEDVPTGLQVVNSAFSTNEDVAQAGGDADAKLKQLEGWGRQLGFDVTFVPGPDAPSDLHFRGINSATSIYRTAEGASESFADGVETLRAQDMEASYPDLTDIEVQEIEQPDLADEVVWLRVTGVTGDAEGSFLVNDFVVLRKGRVRSFLTTVALVDPTAGRDAFIPEVTDLAKAQIRNIDAAL
jgi:hypothetical protein